MPWWPSTAKGAGPSSTRAATRRPWSVVASGRRCGAPQPLFGGEMLKLADMVFRVQVGTQAAVADGAAVESDAQNAPAETAWSVRCPVCGTEYAVEGPEGRVAACTFCKDPLDARQIARVAARAMSGR